MLESGILQVIIIGVLIALALFVAVAKDLIVAALALGAFSLLLALEFFILQAPDVAIAEAGVGAALTTAIYILGIRATRRM